MSVATYIMTFCLFFAMSIFSACDNSAEANEQAADASSTKYSSSKVVSTSSKSAYPDSLKPKDKDKNYPYAGIPRIVIETENRQKIRDRETEIPAKLQIWGKSSAESEIMDLTICGRGNTSWTDFHKKSYKIKFEKKQSMLGMPQDKDWALIANHADKSLMRNYIAYRLSAMLDSYYAPRCEFAELYINGEYLGVYLLSETVKIAKSRVDIPKDDYSYIVEFDAKYKEDEQVIFSNILLENDSVKPFRIHDPKNATAMSLDTLQSHIQAFEKYLKTIEPTVKNKVDKWINIDESIKHYWIQEFSKNADAQFFTSVYFTWVKGEQIKLGPMWDFDLAFGNHKRDSINTTKNWHMRTYWYMHLLKDDEYYAKNDEFWKSKRKVFANTLNTIDSCQKLLDSAAQNNFKRWDILGKTDNNWIRKPFDSYKDAVEDFKSWISKRIEWIDSQQNKVTDDK